MDILMNWVFALALVVLFLGALYFVIKLAVRSAIKESLFAFSQEFYKNLEEIEAESRENRE